MLSVTMGLLALLPASAGAQTFELFEEPSCSQLYPSVISPPPFGKPIDVRALILLDGVNESVARAAMAAVAKPYEPIGLHVKVVEYRPVKFIPVDPDELINESRKAVGGGRPEGADLVYTFTSKEMVSGGPYGGSVAGKVDCVSGVVNPEWAFGVGEVNKYGNEEIIAAHEIAHLLGAHHHWANCAEAIQPEISIHQCTTMINDVGLAGMKFSTLNASIMRAHAEAYLPGKPHPGAPPVGGEPEPEPQPKPAEPGSEPDPAEPQPQPQPQAQPQPQSTAPPAEPAPHSADRQRACQRAQAAFKRAQRQVTAARRKLRRKATPSRRRVVRRAVAARARAERATLKACV